MMKVMTVVGTRPELIKLSCVIKELEKHTNHYLVHTGQNFDYELNQIFFDDLEIRKPDYFLSAVGNSTAETIGNIISKSDAVFAEIQPDAVLVYGDTNSCLCVISAKRRKIPVFHMEAGNRCFDDRVPEEINRRIIDHISDVNMTITEHARRYLIDEGIAPETIFKTGSSMKEVLQSFRSKIDSSDILNRRNLKKLEYFVVSAHREENVDNDALLSSFLDTLNALAAKYQFPVIVSTHPRTRKRLDALGNVETHKLIEFCKPFGFCDYIRLQKDAACVISDSGSLTEEASILGFPAVTIRECHERPEGMDEGTLIMTGLKPDDVLAAIAVVISHSAGTGQNFRIVEDYNVDNVSKKVLRIILSYTNYINKKVWSKER